MAFIESTRRVSRSQGVSIFWGLVSLFFAAAACFYFWQNHENETNATKWYNDNLALQDERTTLLAEKDKLQASLGQKEAELKVREDILKDGEAKLAAEEAHLNAAGPKATIPAQPALTPSDAQAAVVKKFGDALHKLVDKPDIVTRDGRPVILLPNATFFAPGDAVLKPEAKPILNQIAQALGAQADNFELRIESFTSTDAEIPPAPAHGDAKPPLYATGWDLTAARAAAISRFFRDETTLSFNNVLVLARGDSEPISTGAKADPATNRRIEITIAPVPAAFQPPAAAPEAPSKPASPPKPTPKKKVP